MTKNAKTKLDVYQNVTDRIIAALESGTVPWRKPWKSTGGPYSIRNKKPYRGINVFLLELASMNANYTDPRWGTYKAISEAGGQVRKGEKGTLIILWKPFVKEVEENGEKKAKKFLMLRSYTVFNAEQADGLKPLDQGDQPEFVPSDEAEKLVEAYADRPPILYGRSGASYSPLTDQIGMPNREDFDSPDAFYTTLFHELTHSTGSESRLKRINAADFLSREPYSKEELVAEMGAAMMAGLAGIESAGGEQSAAYIKGWLSALKDDTKLVIQAAAQAQKAADYMVGKTFEDEKAEIEEKAA